MWAVEWRGNISLKVLVCLENLQKHAIASFVVVSHHFNLVSVVLSEFHFKRFAPFFAFWAILGQLGIITVFMKSLKMR